MPVDENIYGNTLARFEQDIAHTDLTAAAPSIAISLRRIANAQALTVAHAYLDKSPNPLPERLMSGLKREFIFLNEKSTNG